MFIKLTGFAGKVVIMNTGAIQFFLPIPGPSEFQTRIYVNGHSVDVLETVDEILMLFPN